MSLYNMLFGVNQMTPILLQILGIEPNDIPRFRNCYLDNGFIVIYTRTGGGNREYYDEPNEENQDGPWNSTLRENENFSHDEDDEYDTTYANFYFNYPLQYKNDLTALEKMNTTHKPSEQWQQLFNQLENQNGKE